MNQVCGKVPLARLGNGDIVSRNGKGRRVVGACQRLSFGVLAFALALILCAGAQAQSGVPFIANPLVPDSARPGGKAFTLTVNGANFTASSVVSWNGSTRVTTYVSPTQLTAAILSTDLATGTTASVTVANGGANSNIAYFPVAPVRSIVGTNPSALTLASGSVPTGVAFGDFNKDGKLDMAICDDYNNTVTIYFGNGDGTFQPPTNADVYQVGNQPLNIVVGDLNHDGYLDLVTADGLGSHISVLLGQANGLFAQAQQYATGGLPQSITIGDFNRDGNLDIATPNAGDNTVSVLLGNGDGTFKTHVDYPVGTKPFDVKTADLNGDGILDLVATNLDGSAEFPSGSVSVLIGNGDPNGTFQTQVQYAAPGGPNAVGVGDLNGDGHPDLLTSNGATSFTVLLNSGTGTFPTHVSYPSCHFPAYVVGLADLKNNGNLDAIIPNFGCTEVTAAFGNGDGTFVKIPSFFPVDTNPDALGVADLNGDGLLDIVVLDEFVLPPQQPQATILLQSPNPEPTIFPTYVLYTSVEVGKSSPAFTITVTNKASSAITMGTPAMGGTDPSVFTISSNNCPASLAPQASCQVGVTFTPLTYTDYVADVLINDSGGEQAVQLNGTGLVNFDLSSDNLQFPLTLIGQTSTLPVTMTSISNAPIAIDSVQIGGADPTEWTQTNNCGSVLNAYQSCEFEITFAPDTYGGQAGTVLIFTNSTTPKRAIALRGTGYAITYSPTSLNFGNVVVGQPSTLPVTFNNADSVAMQILSVVFIGQNPKHAITFSSTCPNNSFPANGSCAINVTFTPPAAGTLTGTMSVGDADPTGPQLVAITGTGVTQNVKH
jgi:hypothetical protein